MTTAHRQSKHIVIHRPVNATVSTVPQGQKHILLRKPKASAAQIMPANSSQGSQTQAGKHAFAYLGTLIKPNKSRESVVIPTGSDLDLFFNVTCLLIIVI